MVDAERLGTYTFPAFLVGAGMHDLRKVAEADHEQAKQQQRRVAQQLRDSLRKLLRSAAQRGVLPWGNPRITEFAQSKNL